MTLPPERRRLARYLALGLAVFLLLLLLGAALINPRLTRMIASDHFRIMLDGQTSKGLKFIAHYAPLTRDGLLGVRTAEFHGTDGLKTIVSLDAYDITGWFQPFGFFLQRWQVNDIHISHGTVWLQKTETSPGASRKAPGRPWWGWVWPYRVHLEDVKIDEANVLFKLQDKESGIYKTFLEITPNGRDFEYDARGGQFKTPITPALEVQHIHLLIRRPRLYCPDFVLASDPAHPERQVRATGDAGLQDDRSITLKADLRSLDLGPFFPPKLRGHVLGLASGHLDYRSTGTGLETATGGGAITVAEGMLRALPQIAQYVKLTGSPDPGDLPLQTCRMDLKWEQGAIKATNIDVESNGVFHATGALQMTADKSIHGELELGLAPKYLKWLPTYRNVFTRQEGDYCYATVHLTSEGKKMKEDLSPRIIHEVAQSPSTALKLFFNQAGSWLDFD